ncbi:hypothetical protein BDR26DRAFT_929457 [Obelidium mucronatum]|nr:hypothetical protein BDR26DRAFT_929457 [Obelidium mucronatum]
MASLDGPCAHHKWRNANFPYAKGNMMLFKAIVCLIFAVPTLACTAANECSLVTDAVTMECSSATCQIESCKVDFSPNEALDTCIRDGTVLVNGTCARDKQCKAPTGEAGGSATCSNAKKSCSQTRQCKGVTCGSVDCLNKVCAIQLCPAGHSLNKAGDACTANSNVALGNPCVLALRQCASITDGTVACKNSKCTFTSCDPGYNQIGSGCSAILVTSSLATATTGATTTSAATTTTRSPTPTATFKCDVQPQLKAADNKATLDVCKIRALCPNSSSVAPKEAVDQAAAGPANSVVVAKLSIDDVKDYKEAGFNPPVDAASGVGVARRQASGSVIFPVKSSAAGSELFLRFADRKFLEVTGTKTYGVLDGVLVSTKIVSSGALVVNIKLPVAVKDIWVNTAIGKIYINSGKDVFIPIFTTAP